VTGAQGVGRFSLRSTASALSSSAFGEALPRSSNSRTRYAAHGMVDATKHYADVAPDEGRSRPNVDRAEAPRSRPSRPTVADGEA